MFITTEHSFLSWCRAEEYKMTMKTLTEQNEEKKQEIKKIKR